MSTPVERTVKIYIDQDQAQASLEKLTKRSQQLEKAIATGEKAGKDMSKQIDELGRKKAKIAELEGVLSGKFNPSLRMSRQYVKQLHNELQSLSEDAPGYAKKFETWKAAAANLKEMESRAKGLGRVVKSSFSKFMSNAMSVAGGVVIGETVQAAIQKVTSYLSGLVTGNAELSDSIADIAKATGMTDEQVEKLNKSLGKIDTRTKTKELREIAIALGQLGVEVTDESVANLDRLVVALGDEFEGGASQITKEVSILRNNLQDIKTGNYGDDVLKIGNALNVLGAEGLATAPVVTDIANRVAGVAQTLGVSSGEILGVAATFQELGIEQERGSTAFIRILQRMTQNVKEYGKIAEFAGVTNKDFAELVNSDIVGALMKVSEGARIAGSDNIAFGAILKDLEADGSGAGEVLSKLSQNSEMLTGKIKLATGALTETNSITDEFNKKNNNAAAVIEKIGKKISSYFINGNLMNGVTNVARGFGRLIGVIDPLQEKFDTFKAAEKKVKDLELSVTPLLDRYEELQKRTDLNNTEQSEMNQLIKDISRLVPYATTEMDKYGRVVAISTDKVRDYTKAQRESLKVKNRDVIKDYREQIKEATEELLMYQGYQQNLPKRWEQEVKKYGHDVDNFFTSEIQRVNTHVDELQNKLLGLRTLLKELTGDEGSGLDPLTDKLMKAMPNFKDRFKPQPGKDKPTPPYTPDGKDHTAQISDLLREFELLKAEVDTLATDETQRTIAEHEKQLVATANKYKELTEKAKKYGVTLHGLTETQHREMQALQEKQAKELAEKEFSESQKNLDLFHQQEKEELLRQLHDKQISQEEYHTQLYQLEQDQTADRLQLAMDYAGDVKAAEAYAQQQRTQQLQQGIDERNRLEQKSNRDRMAVLERNVLVARKGSKAELDAKQAQLTAEFEIETAHLEKSSNEYQLKETQLQENLQQMDTDFLMTRVQTYMAAAQQIFGMWQNVLQLEQEARQQAHDADMNRLDKEAEHYKKMLDDKRIGQAYYDKKIEEIENKKRKKQYEFEKDQFYRRKKAALAEIAMSTAQAIIGVWAQNPNPIYGGIMTAVIAGIGGYQAGLVADQEFPEMAKGGMFLDGPSHANGGIDAVDSSGRKVAEVEGGEVVLSKDTVRNNPEIVSQLLNSSMNRNGAKVPEWLYSRPVPMRKSIPLYRTNQAQTMESGGVIPSGSSSSAGTQPNAASLSPAAMQAFVEAVDKFGEITKNGIKAKIYYNEIDEQNSEMQRITGRSRMAG